MPYLSIVYLFKYMNSNYACDTACKGYNLGKYIVSRKNIRYKTTKINSLCSCTKINLFWNRFNCCRITLPSLWTQSTNINANGCQIHWNLVSNQNYLIWIQIIFNFIGLYINAVLPFDKTFPDSRHFYKYKVIPYKKICLIINYML